MMFKRRCFVLFSLVLVALLLVLNGCGGGDDEDTEEITEAVKAQVEKVKKEQEGLSPSTLSERNREIQIYKMGNETNYPPLVEFSMNYEESPPKFMWEVIDKNIGDKHSGIIYIANYEYKFLGKDEDKPYGRYEEGKLSAWKPVFTLKEWISEDEVKDTGVSERIDVDEEQSRVWYGVDNKIREIISGDGQPTAIFMAKLEVTDGINTTAKEIGPFRAIGFTIGEEYKFDPKTYELRKME